MCESEALWTGIRWDVRRELEGRSAGKLKLVDKTTGRVDWPIQYHDGAVAFDFPERFPYYVEQVVKVCYQPDRDLKVIRLQLGRMVDFLFNTPHPEGDHWSWTGDTPYYISEYDPKAWSRSVTFVDRYDSETRQVMDYRIHNAPIWRIWEDTVAEMKRYGMDSAVQQAEQLPIADLLAASKKWNKPA